MKRLLHTITLLSIILGFSCTHNKKASIGFLLPNLTDGRYPKDRDFFEKKITELGGSVEIADAKNDPQLQEEQANKMISDGVKVIVVCAVNQNLAANIIRKAHSKGVITIGYERLISNAPLDYFIAFDHYLVGKQQANYAIQKKPTGNYVMICGDKTDKNAELIEKGQMEVITPLINSGKIKLLYNAAMEDWSPIDAQYSIKKLINLTGENIDVILCANDGMAGGINLTLDELLPGNNILVTGLDADLQACNRVVNGKQSMTVYKPFKKEADITAELCWNILNGKSIKNMTGTISNGSLEIPTISLQGVVLDISNLKTTLINDGYLKESDFKNN